MLVNTKTCCLNTVLGRGDPESQGWEEILLLGRDSGSVPGHPFCMGDDEWFFWSIEDLENAKLEYSNLDT